MKAFLKSFIKKDWTFEDYKVEVFRDATYNQANVEYSAKFKNASWVNLGATPEEAINRLKHSFEEYKKKKPLPRPGTSQKFKLPSAKKFAKYYHVAPAFFEFIDWDPYSQIDDEFTIADLEIDNEMLAKLELEYGFAISSKELVIDIFEKISKSERA